jgi:murein DD-endopeptidase MepM/ murein hydrolase activator NlpD
MKVRLALVLVGAACLSFAATAQDRARDPFMLNGTVTQGAALLGVAPRGTRTIDLDGVAVPVAADGRFLIAFDRDAKPAATLTARLADGRSVVYPIVVAPRAWDIERVDTPLIPTKNSENFLARRKPELEAIAAARALKTDADGWRQSFAWPQKGRMSGMFGNQRVYQGKPGDYHGGVDVALPAGTPVFAPANGVVILAADHPFTLEGNLLMLDHGMGLNSAFLHLSRIDVKLGDHVTKGQQIGAVGATGRATGPHMHWGMKWNAARIDPILLSGPMPAGR